MEACLGDENFNILVLYLDDILVFSGTLEEDIDRLDPVKLKSNELKIKRTKCHFFQKEIDSWTYRLRKRYIYRS